MNVEKVVDTITKWLIDYSDQSKTNGYVVGVSGGIDSAVVSTLCARTGKPTICVSMPIRQNQDSLDRSILHMMWLEQQYKNVKTVTVDLTNTFDSLMSSLPEYAVTDLSAVNSRSRLRMCLLYAFANAVNYIVVGTGNKVEDMGVCFFTKYGDGGVDVSPIGDLLKTEVYEVANYLQISQQIKTAKPSDDLWTDCRSDEDQIGATYPELEWAMGFCENYFKDLPATTNFDNIIIDVNDVCLTERQQQVLRIFINRHRQGVHKMMMPPICELKIER